MSHRLWLSDCLNSRLIQNLSYVFPHFFKQDNRQILILIYVSKLNYKENSIVPAWWIDVCSINQNLTRNVILAIKTIILKSTHFSSLAPARSPYIALDGRFRVLKFLKFLIKKIWSLVSSFQQVLLKRFFFKSFVIFFIWNLVSASVTYTAFKETGFTRDQAADDCVSKGLRLANVYSQEEQDALNQVITDVDGLERGKTIFFWCFVKKISSILAWNDWKWRDSWQRRSHWHWRKSTSILRWLAIGSAKQQIEPSKWQTHNRFEWRLCATKRTWRMERRDLHQNLVSSSQINED